MMGKDRICRQSGVLSQLQSLLASVTLRNLSLLCVSVSSSGKWGQQQSWCENSTRVCCCCCCYFTSVGLTLCDPIDGSPPGSPVPGILQARTLEWVSISFSNAWKWKVKVKSLSRVQPSVTPWTAAHQAPPSMGFSRQEYWSGVSLPSLQQGSGDLQMFLAITVL